MVSRIPLETVCLVSAVAPLIYLGVLKMKNNKYFSFFATIFCLVFRESPYLFF